MTLLIPLGARATVDSGGVILRSRGRRLFALIEIERLLPVPPREAWPDEARDFTPWLAKNLDRLSEVIGVTLELEDSEVRVQQYFADIVALDPVNNRKVLIENQLGRADHKHLGQLLTYLAGLEVQIVVWIATDFSEAHLSAWKWLNEHSSQEFSFFAVQLKTVRIGESAPALLFDVLERPNEWERTLHRVEKETRQRSKRADDRRAYWTRFVEKYPDVASLGMTVNGSSSQWLKVDGQDDVYVSIYMALDGIGLFLRGTRGVSVAEFNTEFAPFMPGFSKLLMGEVRGGAEDGSNHLVWSERFDMTNEDNWDAAIDWHYERAQKWRQAAAEVLNNGS